MWRTEKKKASHPKTFPQNKQKGKKENRLRTNVAVLFPLGFFSARVQLQKEWSVHQLVLHQSASAQSLGSYKSGFQRSSYFFFTFWFVFNLIKTASSTCDYVSRHKFKYQIKLNLNSLIRQDFWVFPLNKQRTDFLSKVWLVSLVPRFFCSVQEPC